MSGVLDTAARLASPWAYIMLGLLAAAESAAFVGLAIPGEAAMLLGGFLAHQGRVNLAVMMAAGAVGAVVGDSVGYEIGRVFGEPLKRSRLGRRVGHDRWARGEAYLRAKGGRAVFLGRFVGVLRALVPALAGMSRMPYRTFLPWNAAGGVIWAPGLVLAGYLAGRSYQRVEQLAGRASLLLAAVLVLVGGVVLSARWVARHPEHVRALTERQLDRPWVARLRARYQRQLTFLAERLRPGRALGLTLTASVVALAGAGWAFGAVLQDVLAGDEGVLLDGPVQSFLVAHREAWLTPLMRAATDLGNAAVLGGLVLLAGLVWWARTRCWRPLGLLVAVYLGAPGCCRTPSRPSPTGPARRSPRRSATGPATPSPQVTPPGPPPPTACSPPCWPPPPQAGAARSPDGPPRYCSPAWSACLGCTWAPAGSPTCSAGSPSAPPGCSSCSQPPASWVDSMATPPPPSRPPPGRQPRRHRWPRRPMTGGRPGASSKVAEVTSTRRGAATLPGMAGCCPSRDYRRLFNQRFAGRLANRYRKRGLDRTARKMVEFLHGLGLDEASVLEIGGGVGELEIELLKAGAAHAQNLELSPAYEHQARTLAEQAGVRGRLDWRLHDLAADPGAVAPADLVVLHRVVCCYPDYERLLGAAADHARRALVFSYPPRNALSRAFYVVFNLVMRLTRSSFRGFAHPPGAMLGVLEDHGLRRTYQGRSRIWQIAGLQRAW